MFRLSPCVRLVIWVSGVKLVKIISEIVLLIYRLLLRTCKLPPSPTCYRVLLFSYATVAGYGSHILPHQFSKYLPGVRYRLSR